VNTGISIVPLSPAEQFVALNLSVELETDFHQLNRIFESAGNFDGKLAPYTEVVRFWVIILGVCFAAKSSISR
jgi:hypothetical protein